MRDTAQNKVDPWRFAGGFLKNVLSGSIPDQPTHAEIPWAPVRKPLSECKVALLTTAGVSMKTDAPFDMDYERKNPTRGDSSFRKLRGDATSQDIDANHLHIDTGYIERDLNVALPLARLDALVAAGEVGASAQTHYSIMGFQGNDSSKLENESAPAIAEALIREEVDLFLLAPV
ncbi:MAG: glycine/sarcosine/betaine reductase selenoprotein B family protein [Myxococcales bacterium]